MSVLSRNEYTQAVHFQAIRRWKKSSVDSLKEVSSSEKKGK